MTEHDQRIAIAKFCGWQKHTQNEVRMLWYRKGVPFLLESDLPDYTHDLNAMHEAEKRLNYEQWLAYMPALHEVCGRCVQYAFHSTAAQRAEALLRTLNLWVDPSP